MRRTRSAMSYYAELEAKRFSRSEFYELLSLWFPRTAAFAVMGGRGALAAVVPQDPRMDLVGTFYVRLDNRGKKRWTAFFNGMGTMRERAQSVGLSKSSLYDWKDDRMEELAAEFDKAFPQFAKKVSGID